MGNINEVSRKLSRRDKLAIGAGLAGAGGISGICLISTLVQAEKTESPHLWWKTQTAMAQTASSTPENTVVVEPTRVKPTKEKQTKTATQAVVSSDTPEPVATKEEEATQTETQVNTGTPVPPNTETPPQTVTVVYTTVVEGSPTIANTPVAETQTQTLVPPVAETAIETPGSTSTEQVETQPSITPDQSNAVPASGADAAKVDTTGVLGAVIGGAALIGVAVNRIRAWSTK